MQTKHFEFWTKNMARQITSKVKLLAIVLSITGGKRENAKSPVHGKKREKLKVSSTGEKSKKTWKTQSLQHRCSSFFLLNTLSKCAYFILRKNDKSRREQTWIYWKRGGKTYLFFPPLAFFLKIFVSCARNISRMYFKVKKYARKNVVPFIWW